MLKRLGFLVMVFWSTSCAMTQRIESAFDCNGICQRYASCFSKDYDTDACAARCRRSAAEDADYRRKANVCEACISERSCAAATFSCLTECVSVVP